MSGLPSAIRAVTLELTQARLDRFDPHATVDFLADRGVNTIVCFAIGYGGGEAYYPSSLAPEHPALQSRDLFGEVCARAAGRGLALIAYVNALFAGPEFYEPHPDWVQRWADGRESTQTGAKMLCPNSPYGEHIVAVSAEIAERYPIAGFYLDEPSLQSWCACAWCQARYARDTGSDLPLAIERGTPEFARFLSWREGVVSGFVDAVASAVRAGPEVGARSPIWKAGSGGASGRGAAGAGGAGAGRGLRGRRCIGSALRATCSQSALSSGERRRRRITAPPAGAR